MFTDEAVNCRSDLECGYARLEFHSVLSVIIPDRLPAFGVFGINPRTWTRILSTPRDWQNWVIFDLRVSHGVIEDCLLRGYSEYGKRPTRQGGVSYRKRYFIGFVIIFNFWMRNKWKVAAAREARSARRRVRKKWFYLGLFLSTSYFWSRVH